MNQKDIVRLQAESSFYAFGKLVLPNRMFAAVHEELMAWITNPVAFRHQLVLLPRDHQKSFIAILYAVWQITVNPAIRILYVSSTSNLARKQLKLAKDILTSKIYRFYWPEMVNEDEGKREKWTESEISVDHPKRKEEFVRDPTIITAGLTTTVVGLHCDLLIGDDIVIWENSYTDEGRSKVSQQFALLASVAGAVARILLVGTRYAPQDLYAQQMAMIVVRYDEHGLVSYRGPLYEKFERQVESIGDGSGEFLWPRQKRYDGIEFGFNRNILEEKKAQYEHNLGMFYAQYYNNPNMLEAGGINPETFQYFDRALLKWDGYNWTIAGRRLNIIASIDFAYSLNASSDYTAIVVVGADSGQNYYVLDIDRFKTTDMSIYYDHLLSLYKKWEFKMLIAEATAAQEVIVNDLKKTYIYRDGLALSIKHFKPDRALGKKEERITAVLKHKYDNRKVWHYKGGNCEILEEELVQSRPTHDDIKDSLATCILHSSPPTSFSNKVNKLKDNLMYHVRFGGYG